ncbi:MAG: hypothetical protein ACYTBJ_12255 [Planctomycetota bacterium]
MANKNRSQMAFEKGRFNGLVDEGKSLRQKLAFTTELAENTKPAKNPCDLFENPLQIAPLFCKTNPICWILK